MQVVINEDDGTVYISLGDAEPVHGQATHQWHKFGVFPHWDGHGGLIGMEFTNTGRVYIRMDHEQAQA